MKKVVLITGSGSGIGMATVKHLLNLGYIVYATSRTPDKLSFISDKNLHPIKLDIKNFQQIKQLVDMIVKQESRLDILINNAGYGLVSSVEDATEEQMQEQFDINLFGMFRLTKAVVPIMREQQSGIIINVSSFLGKVALPLLSFYSASKFAVEGMTDALRYELKDHKIRVHSVMPGFFHTDFTGKDMVQNHHTFSESSPYKKIVSNFIPKIVKEINDGNDPHIVAQYIEKIIKDKDSPARVHVGESSQKFLPMRAELSDEDFEHRIQIHYNLS